MQSPDTHDTAAMLSLILKKLAQVDIDVYDNNNHNQPKGWHPSDIRNLDSVKLSKSYQFAMEFNTAYAAVQKMYELYQNSTCLCGEQSCPDEYIHTTKGV